MQEASIQLISPKAKALGQVWLQPLSPKQARSKALLGLFTCWGLVLVTLPIPIVHIIAPPLLFLLGPLVGYLVHKLYKGAVDIVKGGACCPDCSVVISLAGRDAHWPLDVVCPACQVHLQAVLMTSKDSTA